MLPWNPLGNSNIPFLFITDFKIQGNGHSYKFVNIICCDLTKNFKVFFSKGPAAKNDTTENPGCFNQIFDKKISLTICNWQNLAFLTKGPAAKNDTTENPGCFNQLLFNFWIIKVPLISFISVFFTSKNRFWLKSSCFSQW